MYGRRNLQKLVKHEAQLYVFIVYYLSTLFLERYCPIEHHYYYTSKFRMGSVLDTYLW